MILKIKIKKHRNHLFICAPNVHEITINDTPPPPPSARVPGAQPLQLGADHISRAARFET